MLFGASLCLNPKVVLPSFFLITRSSLHSSCPCWWLLCLTPWFRRLRPSHQGFGTPCKSWTPSPARTPTQSTSQAPPQTSGWIPAWIVRCRQRRHREWRRGLRSADTQSCGSDTAQHFTSSPLVCVAKKEDCGGLTSRKLAILLSRLTMIRCVSVSIFLRSSSLCETYQRLSRVLPCLFCSRMNRIYANVKQGQLPKFET